jgi:sulfonate dioxygenase
MAPIATSTTERAPAESALKQQPVKQEEVFTEKKSFNPFYSPVIADDGNDEYPYSKYKVCPAMLRCLSCLTSAQPTFPNVKWEPLKELEFSDRGLHADSSKKNLFAAASKIRHLTPAIGTEILGIDLRQLTNAQKDELYVCGDGVDATTGLIYTFSVPSSLLSVVPFVSPHGQAVISRTHR